MAREDRVTIMLEEVIKNRFHYYAGAMGLSASALGAFILGQWVFAQDRVNGPMMEEMKNVMTSAVKKQLDDMVDLMGTQGDMSKVFGEIMKGVGGDPGLAEQTGAVPQELQHE